MSDKELIKFTDETIGELVTEKTSLQKAYNYYNGIRDKEQFRYLEENFGIGSPTSVEFTPLLKKHVDVLVGEFLGAPLLPKISCKDSDTISAMNREKLVQITNKILGFLRSHLSNAILMLAQGKDATDNAIKELMDHIIESINLNFVSLYEVAAQNVLLYIIQSRETDIVTKLRLLFTDLLITGYCFYRVTQSLTGTNIRIEVLNPLNTFIDRNPDSPYIKDSYRCVIRNWYSKSLILAKFGRDLSKDDVLKLKENWRYKDEGHWHTAYSSVISVYDDLESDNNLGYPDKNQNLIPVYEVEWIDTDDDYYMQRYLTVRIADDIYILKGIDHEVIRSKDNPKYCSLSINGVYFLNRSKEPYSLILKCAHLQD